MLTRLVTGQNYVHEFKQVLYFYMTVLFLNNVLLTMGLTVRVNWDNIAGTLAGSVTTPDRNPIRSPYKLMFLPND